MADMRLRRAALSGLRVRVPDVDGVKMVEKVVGIFSLGGAGQAVPIIDAY